MQRNSNCHQLASQAIFGDGNQRQPSEWAANAADKNAHLTQVHRRMLSVLLVKICGRRFLNFKIWANFLLNFKTVLSFLSISYHSHTAYSPIFSISWYISSFSIYFRCFICSIQLTKFL